MTQQLFPTPKQWLNAQRERTDLVGEVARSLLPTFPPGAREMRNHCTFRQWDIIQDEWEAVERHPKTHTAEVDTAGIHAYVDEMLTWDDEHWPWYETAVHYDAYVKWGGEASLRALIKVVRERFPSVLDMRSKGRRGWAGVRIQGRRPYEFMNEAEIQRARTASSAFSKTPRHL